MIGGSDIARLAQMERRARQQAEAEAWPEGVIARYLTVGGATVDLALKQIRHTFPDGISGTRGLTTATCTGCPASGESPHWRTRKGTYGGSWDEDIPAEKAEADARDWAQRHAEKCRALPKPEAQQ